MFDPDRIDDIQVNIDPDERQSISILVVGWDTEGKRKREPFNVEDSQDATLINAGVRQAMQRRGLLPTSG